MLRNRWAALFFVCSTAFGAATLIGDEDDQGLLLTATDELAGAGDDMNATMQELAKADERPVITGANGAQIVSDEQPIDEFASDEDLIDDTRGFDPEPDVNPADQAAVVEEEGDVVMYIDDDRSGQAF